MLKGIWCHARGSSPPIFSRNSGLGGGGSWPGVSQRIKLQRITQKRSQTWVDNFDALLLHTEGRDELGTGRDMTKKQ